MNALNRCDSTEQMMSTLQLQTIKLHNLKNEKWENDITIDLLEGIKDCREIVETKQMIKSALTIEIKELEKRIRQLSAKIRQNQQTQSDDESERF